jgi:hypothetical protein
MFNFKPKDTNKPAKKVPFFEDATAANGWAGINTGKSIDTLKSEIISAMSKLGGLVTGFELGTWGTPDVLREGYRIHYVVESPDGHHVPGYIDVAGLPIKPVERYDNRRRRTTEQKQEDALKAALWNVKECLDHMWKLQLLSPGFAALMPFMIATKGVNLTQLWSETSTMKPLLPMADDFKAETGDIIDGQVKDM